MSTTTTKRNIHIDPDPIPIPPPNTGPKKGKAFKYPFHKLEVGESFFVENLQSRNLGGSVTYASKVLNRKFITRTMEGGVRVWRTE